MNNFRANAQTVVGKGLANAYQIHQDLGESGAEARTKNQFGDEALAVDVMSEKVCIDSLQELANDVGATITVHSEEHGRFLIKPTGNISQSKDLKFTAVIDGIDGSAVYKSSRGIGLYGTMFALFDGDDPAYDDYLSAGLVIPSKQEILLATNGAGVSCINAVEKTLSRQVTTDAVARLSVGALVFVDDRFPDLQLDAKHYDYHYINQRAFGDPLRSAGYRVVDLGSTAAACYLIATGQALLLGDATRKGNLEYATMHAIIKEAGGAMAAFDPKAKTFEPIGPKSFLSWGQDRHIPTVTVANDQVLSQLEPLL
jgi:fructose-1,6-bisphosphatase/inositol monophosphatase family enzyme